MLCLLILRCSHWQHWSVTCCTQKRPNQQKEQHIHTSLWYGSNLLFSQVILRKTVQELYVAGCLFYLFFMYTLQVNQMWTLCLRVLLQAPQDRVVSIFLFTISTKYISPNLTTIYLQYWAKSLGKVILTSI